MKSKRSSSYLTGLLMTVAVSLLACAPAAQPSPTSPAAAPVPPATAPPARTEAQAPAAAKPDAAAKADWQAEWNKAVAAAKQEGKLAISATQSELYRQALMVFEQDYPEIKLEYTPMNGRDFWPRLMKERDVGQYLWDLRIGGVDLDGYKARDAGALDSVRAQLLLPEVADESKWLGGFETIFADKERKHVFAFNTSLSGGIVVNRDLVSESDLPSQKELVDPRWRGKIVIQDPRGGSGVSRLSVMLKVYGEPFVTSLLKQDLVISGDKRQIGEWVIRGRYPIAIGIGSDVLEFFQQEGLGQNVKKLAGVEAPAIDTVQLVNRAAHPNAARVFINWLLTPKVQARISDTVKQNSTRLDVPPVVKDDVIDPKRLAEFLFPQREEFLPFRERAQQLATEILK